MLAPLKGSIVVALSLRLDDADGRMNGHLTTILTEARLGTILDDQTLPAAWMKGLYDRKLQPIVADRDGHKGVDLPVPAALATRLADAGPDSTITGTVEAIDDRGIPVLVAYRRSGATNWTSVVTVPLADLNAPVTAALWQMAGTGGPPPARRRDCRPVHGPPGRAAAPDAVRSGHGSEQTGQRIVRATARPPGGGAATHRPRAARLDGAAPRGGEPRAARLEAKVRQSPAGRKALAEVESLLTEALRELRIFTYLLHPPNLEKDGLQATLRDFAEGFAGRTGLVARIRIPEEVDDLPPDLQRAILRVVQEALTNVHRHAGASHVSVDARIMSGRLVVRIRDNGHGMAGLARPDGPIRFGVGIAGMRARLEQFGGDLRIRTGRGGTVVLAMVPVPGAGRAPPRAGRLRMPWLSGPAKADGGALS